MQGEFRGDVTRDTFNPQNHFLRVLIQQGRVSLDTDPNEQASILIHYLQALAVDLMGPHAAPAEGGGFKILSTDKQINDHIDPLQLNDADALKAALKEALKTDGFLVSPGRYYVHGILCENNAYIPFFDQLDPPFSIPDPRKSPIPGGVGIIYLIYLDVWERHINYVQDEIFSGEGMSDPSIREVALGGPDTATRSKIVWQVNFFKLSPTDLKKKDNGDDFTVPDYVNDFRTNYINFLAALDASNNERARINRPGTGKLKARAKNSDTSSTDPCIVKPGSSYRRIENQLYRVEIHDSGSAHQENQVDKKVLATFKWSRENSSVVFPIRKLETSSGSAPSITITLAHLGQNNRFTLVQDDWVEIVDDDYILQNLAKPLLKVNSIDLLEMKVTLSGTVDTRLGQDPKKHPYLRRWDRSKGASEMAKGTNGVQFVEEGKWVLLEDGVEIFFPKPESSDSLYQTGDYWLIPARNATGDVEWPGPINNPTSLPPHGIVHHYAPLAVLQVGEDAADCRRTLNPQ